MLQCSVSVALQLDSLSRIKFLSVSLQIPVNPRASAVKNSPSRNPFIFNQLQNSAHLIENKHFQTQCFQSFAHSLSLFSCKSFICVTYAKQPPGVPPSQLSISAERPLESELNHASSGVYEGNWGAIWFFLTRGGLSRAESRGAGLRPPPPTSAPVASAQSRVSRASSYKEEFRHGRS
jgi:hypothetical protein